MTRQSKSTKRVAEDRPLAPRSKRLYFQEEKKTNCLERSYISQPFHFLRESKKSGKKDEKKRKSAGGDKDRERSGGNDSFKSREFIETSEESSSDSDHKSKSKRKKVKTDEINSIIMLSDRLQHNPL